MEITTKLSNFNFISAYPNPKIHRRHECFCRKSHTVQLPLHRPHRKILQPIKTPTQKLSSTTTTTSSDVLRLLDFLGLPVPNAVYISLIKECTYFRDADEAVLLYANFTRRVRNRHGLALLNRILIMFVSCGCIPNARQVFDEMSERDFNSWAIMIAGYAGSDDYQEVIEMFVNCVQKCFIDSSCCSTSSNKFRFPVSWILVCVLKACAKTFSTELGKQIHCWLIKLRYLEDPFLNSSLINFYGKIGCFEGGVLAFRQNSCHQNVVVWTARIVNHCKEERFHQALDAFKEMGKEGVRKNSFTLSSVLSACAKMSDDRNCGRQVHANAIKLGLESKSYVQCSLVNMYGKFGLIRNAQKVFEMNGGKRNDACWNAMLSSFIQHGCGVEAVKLVYQMKAAGVQPQKLLLTKLWSLCGSEVLEIK